MNKSKILSLIAVLNLFLFSFDIYAGSENSRYRWDECGFGGGGTYLAPGISPVSPDTVLVCGNMGGAFISYDNAENFSQIPFQNISCCVVNDAIPRIPWVFDSKDENCIFLKQGHRLLRTKTGGKKWHKMNFCNKETGKYFRGVTFESICRNPAVKNGFLALVRVAKEKKVMILSTEDSGDTWKIFSGFDDKGGRIIDIYAAVSKPGTVIVVKSNEVLITDSGREWKKASKGLENLDKTTVCDFTGAGNADKDILYMTLRAKGKIESGVYVSRDYGVSWEKVLTPHTQEQLDKAVGKSFKINSRGADFRWLSASDKNPETAFVCYKGPGRIRNYKLVEKIGSNLYRTNDGGKNWEPVLFQFPDMKRYNIENESWLDRQWGWAQCPTAVFVCDANPAKVMVTTGANVYKSENMGKSWRQIANKQSRNNVVPAGQMMNTTVSAVYFDPLNKKRMFIATADFGGVWRSEDRGEKWIFSTRVYSPGKGNNGYALAFEPYSKKEQGRKIWALLSCRHDLPITSFDKHMNRNKCGIIVSEDCGKSWRALDYKGFPERNCVATGITVDKNSTEKTTRLWVALCGKGVYFSADGGRNWSAKNKGISNSNMNVFKVAQTAGGKLYALTIVRAVPGRKAIPGTLYVSSDNGENWRDLKPFPEAFISPLNFTVDSKDENIIYVSSSRRYIWDDSKRSEGIWKTTDGGSSWKKIFRYSCANVNIDPHNHKHLVASCWGSGLYESFDQGVTWKLTNYPFWRPLGVVFDPDKADTVYVFSYGSCLWKGSRASGK